MQLYFTKGLTCVMYDMSTSAEDSFIRIQKKIFLLTNKMILSYVS